MEKIESLIFYALDKTIKTYRQFAQRRMNEAGIEITIDQWLVLNAIAEKPEIRQQEIADKVFKDAASVTRIIELLILKGYLVRESFPADRRRFTLKITREGTVLLKNASKVAAENRALALRNVGEKDLVYLRQVLDNITQNCQ